VALAITGVAGPGGGSTEKPVGMVCLAWATKEGCSRVETRQFKGGRDNVRRQSVVAALQGVLNLLDS